MPFHWFRFALPVTGFLLMVASGCSGSLQATESKVPAPELDVLAIVNGDPVTVEEFERQYARTSQTPADAADDTRAEYEEFLDRYVDYKLKVLAAREAGYPDDPSVSEEIQTYRGQLARPYLLGKEVTNPLLHELYDRRKELVDISHILIRLDENALPEDTLSAWNRLSAIRDSIAAGADFAVMAGRHSEDPSARSDAGEIGHGGRLGYYGGGRLVKAFEDRAYSTPMGGLSPVFRSPYGYHILLVHDRMPAPADRRIAHILIRPAAPTAADSAASEEQIKNASRRLADGESFESVAKDLSADRQSAQNGGDIGFAAFDAGLPTAMRDVAYGLDEPGAVSGPVQTRFGVHFIKFMEERPLGTFEQEEERLRQMLQALPRATAAQDAYISRVFAEMDTGIDSSIVVSWVERMEPDSLYRTLFQNMLPAQERQMTIVTLEDSSYSVDDFSRWFGQNNTVSSAIPQERILAALETYLRSKVIDYQIAALEERDPEFRRTMAEFRDGLMLFRLMEDSVWTAASSDSVALRGLYRMAEDTLRFGERVRAISISSASGSAINSVIELVRKGNQLTWALARVRTDSTLSIRTDTSHVERRSESIFDQVFDMQDGDISDSIPYQRGFIALYHDGIEPARVKTFEEARPDLVTTLQDRIEKNLVDRLRNRYEVQVWKDRLSRVFSDGTNSMERS